MLYDTNNNGILEKKELIEALSATGRAGHGARRPHCRRDCSPVEYQHTRVASPSQPDMAPSVQLNCQPFTDASVGLPLGV